MSGLYRFARCSSLWLLLILTIHAHADGMPNTSPQPELPPAPIIVPAFNHPMLVLTDGRVLAAGGMAISNASAEHTLGAASELWDPQTGQWQVLSNELRFDLDQLVHFNQQEDDRVLFFATRESGNTPEYQARIWDPKSGTVEKLPVGIKPKPDTDIAVLTDGRVLIINGSEGGADIWDSGTNALTHIEEPLLENSRWRALPLKNKQVLLVEVFPDDPAATRKNVKFSVVLLWNPANGECKQIADLPAPFRSGGTLVEMANGTIQATVGVVTYQLAALDKTWSWLHYPDPGAIAENAASQNETAPPPKISPSLQPAASTDTATAWWVAYSKAAGEFKWIILAVLIPAALYLFLRRVDEVKLRPILEHSPYAMFLLILAGIVYINWNEPRTYQTSGLTGYIEECMSNSFPVKGRPTALHLMQSEFECLEHQDGFIDTQYFDLAKARIMSLNVPCRYIGIWSAQRPGGKFIITLTDDNEYTVQQQEGFWGGREIQASWGVHNDEMIWVYSIPFPHLPQFDINRLLPKDRSHFTLVDESGVNTEFELIDAIKSNSCTF